MKAKEARELIQQWKCMTYENLDDFCSVFKEIEDWDEELILDFFSAIPENEFNDYYTFAFVLLEKGEELLQGKIPPRLEKMQGYWCEMLKWSITERS